MFKSVLHKLFVRAAKITGGNPQSPSYWVRQLLGARQKSYSGVDVTEDTALTYSAVWDAVNRISAPVGFLPMPVYERGNNGSKSERRDHHVDYLMNVQPNPWMTSGDMREVVQAHALTWGNGYAEIERNKMKDPLHLWPLLPNMVTPKLDEASQQFIYEIKNKDGSIVKLLPEDILHIKGLGFDGLTGYSVISYAMNNIGGALAAERHEAQFYKNGASITGVLKHEKPLTLEARTQLRDDWERMYSGLDNAHRTAILDAGLDWQNIGIPAKDAQTLEQRKFSVNDVARWYQIPAHMLSELENATFTNIEHQQIEFVMYTLNRWLCKWQAEVQRKLFGRNNRRKLIAEFRTEALLRGDTFKRYQAYKSAREAGWMSPNDILKRENMNPIAGGDNYLIPLNSAVMIDGKIVNLNQDESGTEDDDDKKKEDKERSIIQTRSILYDMCRRIVTKEVKALRTTFIKHGDKEGEFIDRVTNFYHNGFRSNMMQALLPAFASHDPEHLETFIRDYVKDHLGTMLSERSDAMTLLDEWDSNLPMALTERLLTRQQEILKDEDNARQN